MEREPNTIYVARISYGKDSLAMLEAIHQLGYPLDEIEHTEIWATPTLQVEVPEMVAFKKKADKIILDKYGIKVSHKCAVHRKDHSKWATFEDIFYHIPDPKRTKWPGLIYGWPKTLGPWCRKIKYEYPQSVIDTPDSLLTCTPHLEPKNPLIKRVLYIGVACDEGDRIKKHEAPDQIMPLVDIGWTEQQCREWCEQNDLLSPIYATSLRGGCFFCPQQPVSQLEIIYRQYPELWAKMLEWDSDSPIPFRATGQTLHDYDARYKFIDAGLVPEGRKFHWDMLKKKEEEDEGTN